MFQTVIYKDSISICQEGIYIRTIFRLVSQSRASHIQRAQEERSRICLCAGVRKRVYWIHRRPEQRGVAWKVERACAKTRRESERERIGCKHALTVKIRKQWLRKTQGVLLKVTFLRVAVMAAVGELVGSFSHGLESFAHGSHFVLTPPRGLRCSDERAPHLRRAPVTQHFTGPDTSERDPPPAAALLQDRLPPRDITGRYGARHEERPQHIW